MTKHRSPFFVLAMIAAVLLVGLWWATTAHASWGNPVTITSNNASLIEADIVNGRPAVAFFDSSTQQIRYARANDANGTSWGTPINVAANDSPVWGIDLSMAVINGNPAIAYSHYDDAKIYYVRATDANGDTWGTPIEVDSVVSWSLKLLQVDGRPAIAYQNGWPNGLNFVRATDTTGSTWGSPVGVAGGNSGGHLDMLIVNGNPAIAYGFVDPTTSWDLYYVRATNAQGSSWGTPVLVDDTADRTGEFLSMALVNNKPAIAYRHEVVGTSKSLRYMQAADADGTTWNSPVTIETINNPAESTSLAAVEGNPAIAYSNTANQVRYVRAVDADGTTWGDPAPLTIGAGGSSYSGADLLVVVGKPAVFHTGSLVYNRSGSAIGQCLAGTYYDGNSCVPAPAGSYVPTDGATSATLCDQGTYQPNEGATFCLLAPVNMFVDSEGAIAPTACPAHTYTWFLGSTSCQVAVTVTTLVDENDDCGSGDGCSLREAIAAAAPGGDTIDFAVTGTIVLGSELSINKYVTIYGNMPIIVSGNNAVRVFNIAAGNGVTFDSLTIANGRVDDYDIGAGVYNNGTLTVRNSAIVDNVAVNGAGGGIYNHSTGTLVVFNSTFTGNQGPDDGGAIRNEGTATVRNSTFHNNSASLYAGGAIHTHGNLTVDNSTFSENSANIGGAIHVHIATAVTIRNSTFIGNSASIIGGGINVTSGNVHLSNSIIASSLTGMDCNGSLATNANNLIEDNSCSPALSGDPMVGPLQNNGGDTLTFALLPGSPAIGAGNCTSGPTTDQRGVARSQDADCDMGAYEETGTLQCGVTAGNSYPFPNQSGVSIFVNSESDLECLYVDELPFNHPHATGLTDGANLRTGKYWLIGGFQANGTTPAATFNVDLTLPYATASASTRACKWLDGVGPGAGWNCEDGVMGTTFLDGVSVTREDVTAFSQWAVGDSVGPTAVTLSSFSTTPTASSASLLLLLVLLAGLGAVWQWKRRTAVG